MVFSWGAPLWNCAASGKVAMAEMLLSRAADPNGEVYASGTPVYQAYGRADWPMVKLLERYGGLANGTVAGLYRQPELAKRLLAGLETPDTGEVTPGHGLRLGYYAQEHETLETQRSVLSHMRSAAPDLTESQQRKVLGSFLFSGDDVEKPAGVLSGGEKTRLALALLVVSGANVLLLDEPTNNLDPASREEVLGALRGFRGAIVLVTHDEGAVEALSPERVIVLPDGVEDAWSEDFADLVALA